MDPHSGFKLLGTMVFPGVQPKPIEKVPVEETSSAESSISQTPDLSRSIVVYVQPQPLQVVAPAPMIELWPEFRPQLRDILLSLGVSRDHRPVHIFTKNLFHSDVDRNLNRLLIPRKQIKVKFLSDSEEAQLWRKESLDVKVIDPSLIVRDMKLSRWNYRVKSKKQSDGQQVVIDPNSTSYAYSLIHHWMKIVDCNGLVDKKDTVQVWTFRFNGGSIGIILIKEVQDMASSSSSSSSSNSSGTSTVTSWGSKRKRGSNVPEKN